MHNDTYNEQRYQLIVYAHKSCETYLHVHKCHIDSERTPVPTQIDSSFSPIQDLQVHLLVPSYPQEVLKHSHLLPNLHSHSAAKEYPKSHPSIAPRDLDLLQHLGPLYWIDILFVITRAPFCLPPCPFLFGARPTGFCPFCFPSYKWKVDEYFVLFTSRALLETSGTIGRIVHPELSMGMRR